MRRGRGFTLIELLVAMGVLLALSAIVVVSLQAVTGRVDDTAAEQVLDRVQFAEQAWLAKNATWASDPTALEPGRGITVTRGVSTGPDIASIDVSPENELGIAVMSETGTCKARKLGDPLEDGTQVSADLAVTLACTGQAALANL
jgi:prepilin-type N-terminal cleavage/methylation domain-containing protein